MPRIRGYFQRYALYESTFYLLTYLLPFSKNTASLSVFGIRFSGIQPPFFGSRAQVRPFGLFSVLYESISPVLRIPDTALYCTLALVLPASTTLSAVG